VVVKNFTPKFWQWLYNRSPQNSAKPDVQPKPTKGGVDTVAPITAKPLEQYIETESIIGGLIKIGFEEGASRGPDGQLFRAHNRLSLSIGCGHIAAQLQAVDQHDRHIRGIGGPCFYCVPELQKLLQKGLISPFDAERLSLVCTDCGKITESGQLCCPKHYTAVLNPDGTTTYLSPEDAQQQERQNTMKTVLGSIALLFSQDTQEQNNG
jgi:hypothetical protein